ncbi:MAG: hypothetical protein P4N59_23955 [Negativicutes bacterium]|nr:hypothetical protein [Negativicutes bacterium]
MQKCGGGHARRDADKQTLKRLIDSKAANLLFFFQKLDNPAWLDYLDEDGWFTGLPGPQPTDDGRLQYNWHIPLTCLPKMAPIAPEAATRILIKLVIPDNPRVGDQILQGMAGITNHECIRQLRPLIVQLKNNLSRTSWIWIEELLENWFKAEA